jgi:hypothetical protein
MRARLREVFSEGTVAVLATSSRETGPASTLVSWLTVTNRFVRAAPFDCALAILDVNEIRDHGLRSVVFEPPRYNYGPGKLHYERVEKTIIRELRAAPISPRRLIS